jgi:death-on-curing protein
MTKYFDERTITEANFRLIDKYSPKEEKAIRDMGALNMIVNLPEQHVFGQELYPTVYEKAAILFVQLVLKHVFANGNKRTATFILVTFLKINGYVIQNNQNNLEHLSVYVAKNGNKDETISYVVDFIKKNTLKV